MDRKRKFRDIPTSRIPEVMATFFWQLFTELNDSAEHTPELHVYSHCSSSSQPRSTELHRLPTTKRSDSLHHCRRKRFAPFIDQTDAGQASFAAPTAPTARRVPGIFVRRLATFCNCFCRTHFPLCIQPASLLPLTFRLIFAYSTHATIGGTSTLLTP